MLTFFLIGSRLGFAAELDASRILNLLEGSIQSIKSFDVRLHTTLRFFIITERTDVKVQPTPGQKWPTVPLRKRMLGPTEMARTRAEHYRQCFTNATGRTEYLDQNGQPVTQVVYDRETEKTHKPAQARAIIRAPVPSLVVEGGDYLESYRNLYGRVEVIRSFRQRKNVHVSYGGPNGNMIILASDLDLHPTDPSIDLPTWGFQVAVDPEHNFLPVRVERYEAIDGIPFLVRRLSVDEFLDIGGGVMVPVKFTSHFFDRSPGDTFGKRGLEVVTTVDVSRSTWNTPIPDKTFALSLPAGTRVTDHFRNVEFITGKPDPGTNLKELVANARQSIPFTSSASPVPVNGALRLWLATITGFLLIALLFVIFTVRRIKQRQRGRVSNENSYL